jgi:hypothetical protein
MSVERHFPESAKLPASTRWQLGVEVACITPQHQLFLAFLAAFGVYLFLLW